MESKQRIHNLTTHMYGEIQKLFDLWLFNTDDDDLDYESDYEVINTFEWQLEGLDILPKSLVDDASWSHVLSFLRQVRNILSQ